MDPYISLYNVSKMETDVAGVLKTRILNLSLFTITGLEGDMYGGRGQMIVTVDYYRVLTKSPT